MKKGNNFYIKKNNFDNKKSSIKFQNTTVRELIKFVKKGVKIESQNGDKFLNRKRKKSPIKVSEISQSFIEERVKKEYSILENDEEKSIYLFKLCQEFFTKWQSCNIGADREKLKVTENFRSLHLLLTYIFTEKIFLLEEELEHKFGNVITAADFLKFLCQIIYQKYLNKKRMDKETLNNYYGKIYLIKTKIKSSNLVNVISGLDELSSLKLLFLPMHNATKINFS